MAGPHQVWIIPPQATTRQLSSFGLRTVDVIADDDLFVPGYEYHYLDVTVDPPEFYSQIPKGFAGKTSKGIFRWDGDVIEIRAPSPGDPRATEFDEESGETMRLVREGD